MIVTDMLGARDIYRFEQQTGRGLRSDASRYGWDDGIMDVLSVKFSGSRKVMAKHHLTIPGSQCVTALLPDSLP